MPIWPALRNTIALMRCHQWVKNVFVFAAPLFARRLDDPAALLAAAFTFLSFCLISSAVYIFNDIADVEQDRKHPTKRNRPLAARKLTIAYGLVLMVILAVSALALGWLAVSWKVAAVLAVYAGSNVFYSYVLKHAVILDVGFIAVGFILRILAGAYATETTPSYWLVLCTLNVSLFLGFAKRRAELIRLGDSAAEHRAVLEHYSEGFLDQMISIVTTSTLVCYILYTVDDRTVGYVGSYGFIVTIPFVMYGIFRYLYLTYHRDRGGDPTRAILMDPMFLLNNLAWGLACIAVIYWGAQWADWFRFEPAL
ncbi:MAG: decaprenyl-phosphate phosphoribosyltransferase [Candidatus Hydrogenedentota bacterium]